MPDPYFRFPTSDPPRRGKECVLERNGLRFNNMRDGDRIKVVSLSGFSDSDVEDQRQALTGRDDELPLQSRYRGKTGSFNIQIEAGNVGRMRELYQRVEDAFIVLEDAPLDFLFRDWHDSFDAEPGVLGTNYVTNPSFEYADNHLIDWDVVSTGVSSGGTPAAVSDQTEASIWSSFHTGSWSAGSGRTYRFRHRFGYPFGLPVNPGETWSGRAWCKTSSTHGAAVLVRMWARWFDSAGNTISTSSSGTTVIGPSHVSDLNFTDVAPANAFFMDLFIESVPVGGDGSGSFNFWIDDIWADRVGYPVNAQTYFDGDTQYGRWTGEIENSASHQLDLTGLEDYKPHDGLPVTASVDGYGALRPCFSLANPLGRARQAFYVLPSAAHPDRYSYIDSEAVLQFVTVEASGDLGTDWRIGMMLRRQDNGYLLAELTANSLRCEAQMGVNNVTSSDTGITFRANTRYWLRSLLQNDILTVELWDEDPRLDPMGAYLTTLSWDLSLQTISSRFMAQPGQVGIWWVPHNPNQRIEDFEVRSLDGNGDVRLPCRKIQKVDGDETQDDLQYRRKMLVTVRAPRPYESRVMHTARATVSSYVLEWPTGSGALTWPEDGSGLRFGQVLNFQGPQGGEVAVRGNWPACPIIRFYEAENPTVFDVRTGKTLSLNAKLAPGEYIDVCCGLGGSFAITDSLGRDRGDMWVSTSTWLSLPPGPIQLGYGADFVYGSVTYPVQIFWRDLWR